MNAADFYGVFTALATPFSEGRICYPDLEKLVAGQIEAGVRGLVAVGTTGESPTLSNEEHIEVIRATVAAAGGKVPVIAGTGSNSTAEAVELTRLADRAGADAFLQVAPYYNKPSQEGLLAHFGAVAEATDKAIMLYSIPGRCGIEIAVDTAAKLYERHPQICCMKAAEGSCGKVVDYVRTLGPDYAVLSGDDAMTLPFMSVGARGVVSVASNLLPQQVVELVRLQLDGDAAAARDRFLGLYPLFGDLFIEPNPVPVKYAMARAGILSSDEVRSPLSPLTESSRARIDATLESLGIVS